MKFTFAHLTASVLVCVSLLASVSAAPLNVISPEEIATKSAQGLRLLRLSDDTAPEWHTEDELMDLIRQEIGFFDVTEFYDADEELSFRTKVKVAAGPYADPSRQVEVQAIIDTLKVDNLKSYLTALSSFNNRYYQSTTGEEATQWIISTISEIISQAKPTADVSVRRFGHSWRQGSIIATIPGTDPSLPMVVLGGHMDSINSRGGSTSRAPGMDDDGSGSVNLIEAFRALVTADFQPKATVEFQWYAGEEVGLLGSQDIARSYKSQGVQVKGMLQLDMTAYTRPGAEPRISLIPDFTDSALTDYVIKLAESYADIPAEINSPCGYGCSDHASWYRQDYPSAFPFETRFGQHNSNIHTANDLDTVPGFSYEQSLEFSKVAVGFAYELGMA